VNAFKEKRYSFLEGIAFSFCCDTLYAIEMIMRDTQEIPILSVHVPTKLVGAAPSKYITKELKRFQSALEKHYHIAVSPDQLRKSIELYKENNDILHQLKAIRHARQESMSLSEYFTLSASGYFIPVEMHNLMLRDFISENQSITPHNAPASHDNRKKIIISGVINLNLNILQRIEQLGVDIIDDDLCEGSRALVPDNLEIDYSVAPLQIVGDRLLSLMCPIKIDTRVNYTDLLVNLYQRVNADGIIFVVFTFCDPHYLEYSIVRKELADRHIPSLLIEALTDTDNFGQIETRIEAFAENV
jgi:benzoyl-CoA reductase/2-hydroxyglutaryl-CoA dehydratase subunit BcrC/BadD/HgdB